MRKLTVKNFSVIKEAELEFGKITVLIGPQSSGKSLLCRLAFFFSQYVPEFANNVAQRHPPFKEINDAIQSRFSDWFPATTWSNQDSEITYTEGSYSVTASIGALQTKPLLRFSHSFSEAYSKWNSSEAGEVRKSNSNSEPNVDPFYPSGSIYIPSGRAFFSTPNKGFVSMSQKNLDWITQRFSTEVDFEYRAMIASSSERVELLHDFGEQTERILKGRVVFWDGAPRFQFTSDPRILPFDLLSSGTLELLPMLNPLSTLVSNTKFSKYFEEQDPMRGPIFVEEPESGIFPATQYELVCLFAWLTATKSLGLSFALTTHSPYLLSSFNNLIYAGQLANEKPELKDEIARTVPKRYWIENGSFRAYSIHDGILKSILSESGLINGEYLDSVSDTIGNEFDSLLRLEYDHTEAS